MAVSGSGQYQTACDKLEGYIYVSYNYGETWTQISGITNNNWTYASMSASGQYQALSAEGFGIYISNNYGNSWTLVDDSVLSSENVQCVAISASGQYQIAAIYGSNINASSDYGKTWSSVYSGNDWFRIAISASGQYLTLNTVGGGAIFTCQNSISNGVITVGSYSSTSGVTGVAGSIYYDTTSTAGATALMISSGSGWTSVKSFVIDHPIDKNKYLVHGCLEGPEAGVYYRGKNEITDDYSVTIYLPEYVRKLGYDFTVQITPIFNEEAMKTPHYGASRVKNNSFNVYGENGEFFWIVHAKRGNITIEPNKSDVNIKGSGPYLWI